MEMDYSWIWATLASAGASFVTWVFTRRKQTAEAEGSELDNVEKAVAIWRQTAEDLHKEINELRQQITDLRRQIGELQSENDRLIKENEKIKK